MVLSSPQKLWAARKLILTAHNNRKSKPKGQGKTISYERKERQLSCVSTTKQAVFPASEILSHPKYQQEILRIFPAPIFLYIAMLPKYFTVVNYLLHLCAGEYPHAICNSFSC